MYESFSDFLLDQKLFTRLAIGHSHGGGTIKIRCYAWQPGMLLCMCNQLQLFLVTPHPPRTIYRPSMI